MLGWMPQMYLKVPFLVKRFLYVPVLIRALDLMPPPPLTLCGAGSFLKRQVTESPRLMVTFAGANLNFATVTVLLEAPWASGDAMARAAIPAPRALREICIARPS